MSILNKNQAKAVSALRSVGKNDKERMEITRGGVGGRGHSCTQTHTDHTTMMRHVNNK